MNTNWYPIDEFPEYGINSNGEILNIKLDHLVLPHQVTGGALAVRLKGEDRCYYTRSVKVLVARHFVPFDFDVDFFDVSQFDTPIQLDNNPLNVNAQNIRWRPRWFAWNYAHQFNEEYEWYYKGPLFCSQTNMVFKDVKSVGVHYVLLFRDVYSSANSLTFNEGLPPPWPLSYLFTWG